MGPNDYILNVQQPFQAALQGYQIGGAIRADLQQQEAQQAAFEQQRRQAEAIRALASNPNPSADDYARATLLVPGMREHFKQSWEMHTAEQQKSSLEEIGQVHAALTGGKPEYAVSILNKRADALENSGGPQDQIDAARNMAKVIEANPQFARSLTGMKLASIPGGDKVFAALKTAGEEQRAQELQPDAVRKGAAEATTAEVKAKYADSEAMLDLQKKGWDIKGIKADIDYKKQSTRIAAMNADLARQGNDLKRQELQLRVNEAQQKLNDQVREKAATVESARGSMDNLLNTADRFLKVAVDKNGKATSTLRAAAGPVDSRVPTMLPDVADLEALLEALGSQAFMAQVPNMKGMGQLSNAEGEKLQASLQNLSLKQSPEQLIANVKEAQRLILKGRKNLTARYGVPDNVPDTPAAAPSAADVDALVKKYGGG